MKGVPPSQIEPLLGEGRDWVRVFTFDNGWYIHRAVSPRAWKSTDWALYGPDGGPYMSPDFLDREGCLFVVVGPHEIPEMAFGFWRRPGIEFAPEYRSEQILWRLPEHDFGGWGSLGGYGILGRFLDWLLGGRPDPEGGRFRRFGYHRVIRVEVHEETPHGQSPFDVEAYVLLGLDNPVLLPDREFAEWVLAQEDPL